MLMWELISRCRFFASLGRHFASPSRSSTMIGLFFLSIYTRLAIGVLSPLFLQSVSIPFTRQSSACSCSSNLDMTLRSHPTVPATVTTSARSMMTSIPTSCETQTGRITITFTRTLVPVVTRKRPSLSTYTLLVCPLHAPQLFWATYATPTH